MNSKTANSSKILLKVPINLNVPVKTLHRYSAYLWFKKFNRYGIIHKSSLPKEYRNRTNYWIKKLVSAGFMNDCGSHYTLKAYQAVWRLMGVKKCKSKKGIYRFKYIKFIVENDKTFLKDVKDGVFKHLVERKKNQIAYRLASGRSSKRSDIRKRGTIVEMSGERAKYLFGYKHFTTGIKYRNKYFKVKSGIMFNYLDEQGYRRYGYECGKISLF